MREFVKRHDRFHRVVHATWCRLVNKRFGSLPSSNFPVKGDTIIRVTPETIGQWHISARYTNISDVVFINDAALTAGAHNILDFTNATGHEFPRISIAPGQTHRIILAWHNDALLIVPLNVGQTYFIVLIVDNSSGSLVSNVWEQNIVVGNIDPDGWIFGFKAPTTGGLELYSTDQGYPAINTIWPTQIDAENYARAFLSLLPTPHSAEALMHYSNGTHDPGTLL